jgi:hypothetical protein
MKNYRIFLLSFVTFSGVLSIGFGKSAYSNTTSIEKPETVVELESTKIEKKHSQLETNSIKTKKNQTSVNAKDNVADKGNTSEYIELQMPLDLSIPYTDPEKAVLKIKQNTPAQGPETNIFSPATRKKSRPLQLNGDFLMSPEPEAEKQKSVDGAGIVINIKP